MSRSRLSPSGTRRFTGEPHWLQARPARRGEILDGRFCGHGQDSTGCGASLRRGGHRAGRGETRLQVLDEGADFWGQKAAVRIHGIHGDGGVRVVRQDLGEAAGAHVLANQELRLQDDAMPGQRGGAQHVAVVGPQRRVHAQQPHLSVLLEMPFVAGAGVGVVQAAVKLQVLGRGRRAMPAQVVGRGADQQSLRRQWPRHQRGVLQWADAHGHVVAVFHQVHHAVVQVQVDDHVRVLLQVFGDGRPQVQDAEGHGALMRSRPLGRWPSACRACSRSATSASIGRTRS